VTTHGFSSVAGHSPSINEEIVAEDRRGKSPMSDNDALNRQIGKLFAEHILSDPSLDDIGTLDPQLFHDPAVLRGLARRCVEEGRKALRAGRHLEGRRLDILSRELQERADGSK
jgi:hypothetical protein